MSHDELPALDGQQTTLDADPLELTAILNHAPDARAGLDRVFDLVYVQLKVLAHRVLGRSDGSTLNPTALVHEAYAKLIGNESLSLQGRQHFYSLCARTMRQIIIDHARRKLTGKRGGGRSDVEFRDDVIDLSSPETLVSLDHALDQLGRRDRRLVDILQYRLFAGLELPEIASLYGVTVRQIQRDWQRARIWIADALTGDTSG